MSIAVLAVKTLDTVGVDEEKEGVTVVEKRSSGIKTAPNMSIIYYQ